MKYLLSKASPFVLTKTQFAFISDPLSSLGATSLERREPFVAAGVCNKDFKFSPLTVLSSVWPTEFQYNSFTHDWWDYELAQSPMENKGNKIPFCPSNPLYLYTPSAQVNYSRMSLATLYIIVKSWHQTKCPITYNKLILLRFCNKKKYSNQNVYIRACVPTWLNLKNLLRRKEYYRRVSVKLFH